MSRAAATVALGLLAVWVLAHLLYVGPGQEATETTLVWIVGFAAACLLTAAIVLVAVGVAVGGSRPAWLRFVGLARNAAVVVGCALVLVGLLHYRETEPRGEVQWLILGLAVLVGAAIVHWWVVRVRRQAG